MRARRVLGAVAAIAVLSMVAVGCQVGVSMWGACSPSSTGNPFGTDGEWVLICRDGIWEPIMTVEEYLRLRRGEHVTRQPLPARPTTTTTSTTTTTTTLPPSTLDVNNTPNTNGWWDVGSCNASFPALPRLAVAQTFTAGLSGEITRVDLVAEAFPTNGEIDPLLIEIVSVDAGMPSSTVIGEGSYTGPGSPDNNTLIHVELTVPAPVVANTSYAVVASTGSDPCPSVGSWSLWATLPSTYAGGHSWVNTASPWSADLITDWSFRTWVRP